MVVDLAEAAAGDVGVDLGGGEAGVAEEFLDGAEVGAVFQQVGGEGVAEGVGADVVLGAGSEDVAVDDAADAAGGERAAAVVEVEAAGVFFVGALFGEEVGAGFGKIRFDGLLGGAAEEDDALAVAFAADEELGGAAGLVDGEADELADAEAGGVEGFEDGAVAEPEGGFVVGRGEELLHVALVEELGEAAALAGGGEADGGVGGGGAAGFEVAIEGAEGGELAGDGGSGVVLFVEVGEEAPEVGRADVGPGAGEARLLKKGGALLEVVGVGAEGRLGGAAAVLEFGEKGVYGLVHGLMLHRRLLPYPRAGCLRDRVRWEGGETGYISRGLRSVKMLERVETVLILVALVSLWPLLLEYKAAWYQVWLVAMLGAMVWVAARRMGRTREAAAEAKRKRDEMEKGGRPPFLR